MQQRVSVLIIGHGSRQQASNLEFEELVACYRQRRPELDVGHGFIELAEPHFSEALLDLAGKTDRIVLVPLFLFAAGHVKNDIPTALGAVRRQFPGVRFDTARELGIHPTMIDLVSERVRAVFQPGADEERRTAVIVVGRGSSDPDANGDFCKFVRLLGERRDFAWVLPSFIGITRPLFEEAVELIACSRPERILVIPYFLFAGRLVTRLQEQVRNFSERYPSIQTKLTPHLGLDERLFRLVDERVQEILKR